jgi:hypothetical protein
MIKQISIQEYARKRKISPSAVQIAVLTAYSSNEKLPIKTLPNVARIEKYGRFYLLDVEMVKIPTGRNKKYHKRATT